MYIPLSPGCSSQLTSNYRSDTTKTITYCRRELPLITRESIPPSPRLVNSRLSRGPLVNLRVLGFALDLEAQEQWSRENNIGTEPDDTYLDRVDMCWQYLPAMLPADCRRTATVNIPNAGLASCIVVATNHTRDDLKRAGDIEMIRRVQAILVATEPPKWYYPKRI